MYGTLKHNGRISLLSQPGAKLITVTETAMPLYDMINLGSFPGVLVGGDSYVVGELWEVDNEAMKDLDRIEGYPTFYNRQIVETLHGPAWMYYLSASDFPSEQTMKPSTENKLEWKNND